MASGRLVSFIPSTVRDAGFDGYVLVNGADVLPYFRQYMFDETFLIERPLQECLGQVMKLEL